ncbi:hypothetical protein ACFSJW_17785 [Flavobacterium artemisiae]|uniref:Uncharacterized protein n=1 Tax=Flavobacterium artemisiae TaxID=2126556 RepID=A0ABW4H988_9FLAO
MKIIKKILLISFIVIIVSISLKKTITNYHDKKKLETRSKIIEGVITDYYEIGLSSYYLHYRYIVDSDIYEKEIMPDKLLEECENDNWCINKKILVRYYVDDPAISEPVLDSITTF